MLCLFYCHLIYKCRVVLKYYFNISVVILNRHLISVYVSSGAL